MTVSILAGAAAVLLAGLATISRSWGAEPTTVTPSETSIWGVFSNDYSTERQNVLFGPYDSWSQCVQKVDHHQSDYPKYVLLLPSSRSRAAAWRGCTPEMNLWLKREHDRLVQRQIALPLCWHGSGVLAGHRSRRGPLRRRVVPSLGNC
jgi:hypothetical protein